MIKEYKKKLMRVNKGWKNGRKNSRKIEWKTRRKIIEEKNLKWKIELKELYLELSAWKNYVRTTKSK